MESGKKVIFIITNRWPNFANVLLHSGLVEGVNFCSHEVRELSSLYDPIEWPRRLPEAIANVRPARENEKATLSLAMLPPH